jgi:Tfp pilus assembly protein PilN
MSGDWCRRERARRRRRLLSRLAGRAVLVAALAVVAWVAVNR